ncbi:probable protein phosphatase 2C 55 [Vigna umbellata]|uniref:probable protein phosphatase 2C 55 n=1 Tax=Vigna umbellata TaxID=87088 RepID=UPI001F5F5F20|nr:probable protein phosphatase 2C 55 [Vigna umbellata]
MNQYSAADIIVSGWLVFEVSVLLCFWERLLVSSIELYYMIFCPILSRLCTMVFTIPVAPGDVIVAGTDGLFDNLYNNEITAVVVHAMRAGLGPQVTAQKIAALARQRALDKDRQTPFSTAAQDAGFRYYGGKLDDTTVVVSYVTGSADA